MIERNNSELDSLWVKLKEIEVVKDAGSRIPLNYISSCLLLIVGSGAVQVAVDGTYYALTAGSAMACSPNQLVSAVVEGKGDAELYALRFDVKPDGEGSEVDIPASGIVHLSEQAKIVEHCQSIAKLRGTGESLQRFRSQALFYEIVHAVLSDSAASRAANRKSYHEVCLMLRRYQKVAGNGSQAGLIKELRESYRNKPAFIDELRSLE